MYEWMYYLPTGVHGTIPFAHTFQWCFTVEWPRDQYDQGYHGNRVNVWIAASHDLVVVGTVDDVAVMHRAVDEGEEADGEEDVDM